MRSDNEDVNAGSSPVSSRPLRVREPVQPENCRYADQHGGPVLVGYCPSCGWQPTTGIHAEDRQAKQWWLALSAEDRVALWTEFGKDEQVRDA